MENCYQSKDLKENEKKRAEDTIIEIEFSNNKIIKANIKDLKKYPYSKLASYFTSLKNIPKRNNIIFLDRNYNTFMQ